MFILCNYILFWLLSGYCLSLLLLCMSVFLLFLSMGYWVSFDSFVAGFQFCVFWFSLICMGLDYSLGLDGVSVFFIGLTSVLVIFCIVVHWFLKYKLREFLIVLYVIELLLMKSFCILDLFFFYVYFESLLIPMFIFMGIWGSRERKIQAAYKFFFYTLLGSVCMLLGMLSILYHLGTTSSQMLIHGSFSYSSQLFMWIFFFVGLCVKVPVYPVHIWLPEAHVEAPTAGSVMLAGVLLKLGVYAIFRYMLPAFSGAVFFFSPLFVAWCLIGLLFSSFAAVFQADLKKLVAYSSVVHMNLMVVGLLCYDFLGIEGSLVSMFSHGLMAGAFFLGVGCLYDRYSSSFVYYYGGVSVFMPIFSSLFFIFLMGNLSFPGTSGFVGELLILNGVCLSWTVVMFGIMIIFFSITVFSMLLYNRIIFGFMKEFYFKSQSDVSLREIMLLSIFCFLMFMWGFGPELFMDIVDGSLMSLIMKGQFL